MTSTDPSFPLFPVLSFLAFIVSFIPFPWHLRNGNIGTCAYMISTGLFSLVEFINSLIWAGNVNNVAPRWCDFSVQIIIAASIGIPASTLSISRQLYHISTSRGQTRAAEEKRRDMIIDWAICLGLPILVILLHFAVQPVRFDIFEDVGCEPATFNTLAAYFLFFIWPILIGICTFVYSALTLRGFYMRRLQLSAIKTANASLNGTRYIRLMLLVFVDMLCNTPLGVFVIVASSRTVLQPFSAWIDTHDFSRVRVIPASEWQQDPVERVSVEINRWLPVFCSFVFFAFFGFAEEAKKNYAAFFRWIGQKFGIRALQKCGQEKHLEVIKGVPMKSFKPRPGLDSQSTKDSQETRTPDLAFHDHLKVNSSPEFIRSCATSSRPLISDNSSARQGNFHLHFDNSSFQTIALNDDRTHVAAPPVPQRFPTPTYREHIQSLRA